MRFVMLLALGALPVPALAQDASAPAAKPEPEKKICRMVEQTGSILLRKRYCLTRAEWTKFGEVTSDRAGRALDQRTLGPNGSFNK